MGILIAFVAGVLLGYSVPRLYALYASSRAAARSQPNVGGAGRTAPSDRHQN